MNKNVRNTGIAVLAVAVAGGVAAFVVRDQVIRHSRDLFSPRFMRRLAALGHMAKQDASVDHVNLLKDFVAWEPRKSLRKRATGIIARMSDELQGVVVGG